MRAVSRQEKQVSPLFFPFALLLVDGLTAMDGSVVEHNHHRFRVGLGQEVRQSFYYKSPGEALLTGVNREAIVQTHQAQHIESFALVASEDLNGLAFFLPAVGHIGLHGEASFVGEIQFNGPDYPQGEQQLPTLITVSIG